MNKFPCKECLVNACCSEDCDKLISNARVIDLYINLYNTCPDCGSDINTHAFKRKSMVICFKCKNGFRKETIIKARTHPFIFTATPPVIAWNTTKILGKPMIVSNLTTTIPHPPSMEETHDVVFVRIEKRETQFIIQKMQQEIHEKFQSNMREAKNQRGPEDDWSIDLLKFSKALQTHINMPTPSWEKYYDTYPFAAPPHEDCSSDIIFIK